MKITVTVISLACFSPGLLAAEEPSPSPTPILRHHAPRPGSVRRSNHIERRHEPEARTGAAHAKAQSQANLSSAAAAQAQAKAADRARTQAQSQAARIETKSPVPRANSDLMSRMGFSEVEIAAEKAREQSTKSGAKGTTETTSQVQRQQAQATSTNGTGVVGNHPTVSPAKADGVAPQKPTSSSTAADPDSH